MFYNQYRFLKMIWIFLIFISSTIHNCSTQAKENSSTSKEDSKKENFVMLPKPTGPYFVATKSIHVEDTSRVLRNSSTKRHWMIQTFYPSNVPKNSSYFRVRGTYPYAAIMRAAGDVEGTFVESFASPYGSINHEWNGDFPVVILAPSFSFGRFDYTILCEELASWGFIVIVTEILHVTSLVKMNDMSSITPKLMDLWTFSKSPSFKNDFLKMHLKDYELDILWIINNLTGIENYLNCPFDKNRIILMGHAEGAEVTKKIALTNKLIAGYIEYYPQTSLAFPIFQPTVPTGKPILTFITSSKTLISPKPNFFDFLNFVQFHFNQNQNQTNHSEFLANQTIINTNGQKDSITDYAYLLNEISAINETKPFGNFMSWFFKLNPTIENRYLLIINENPLKWFINIRQIFIKWMKENNFIN